MFRNPSPHTSETSSQCGYGRCEPVKYILAPMKFFFFFFDEDSVIFCSCGRRAGWHTLQQQGADTVSLENQEGFPEIIMSCLVRIIKWVIFFIWKFWLGHQQVGNQIRRRKIGHFIFLEEKKNNLIPNVVLWSHDISCYRSQETIIWATHYTLHILSYPELGPTTSTSV